MENNAKGGSLSDKQHQNKSTEWTNQLTSGLIDLLEERLCLWNIYDENYRIMGMRDMVLTDICETLGVPKEEVKAKTLNLRSQLGREVAKVNATKSGQAVDHLYKCTSIFDAKLRNNIAK